MDLYVGDQEGDVVAARNANVKAVYLGSGKTVNALSIEPDYRITNINQTIGILRILQKEKKVKNPSLSYQMVVGFLSYRA